MFHGATDSTVFEMSRIVRLFPCILLFLCPCVLSYGCVTYNFENDFDTLFESNVGLCAGMDRWTLSNYSSINIERPHPLSESFLTPNSRNRGLPSCISSFTIPVTSTGVLEVNLYMYDDMENQIVIMIQDLNGVAGNNVVNVFYNSWYPNFRPGWKSLRISIDHVLEHFNSNVSTFFLISLGLTVK